MQWVFCQVCSQNLHVNFQKLDFHLIFWFLPIPLGMYPPANSDQLWSPQVSWFPIPVHTDHKNHDPVDFLKKKIFINIFFYSHSPNFRFNNYHVDFRRGMCKIWRTLAHDNEFTSIHGNSKTIRRNTSISSLLVLYWPIFFWQLMKKFQGFC